MNNPEKTLSESESSRLSLNDLIDSLRELADQGADPEIELVELKKGEVLFEQGDEGEHAYLLMAGMLGVRVKQPDGTETVIDRAAPGTIIGEMALLSGEKRTATVFAVNNAGLIRLSKTKFEQLTAQDESLLIDEETEIERTQRLQLTGILGDMIGEFDTPTLHALQSQLEWNQLAKGEYLFKKGDKADGLYILLGGCLIVGASRPEEVDHDTCDIDPGDTVGEYAMLTGESRAASVYTTSEVNVVKIPPTAFNSLVDDYPEMMVKLSRRIVNRQQTGSIRARV
jgi:CRP-like cAMP-binding protein